MSRSSQVAYEDWVEFLFQAFRNSSDPVSIQFPGEWEYNTRLMVEHYTKFLEDPVWIVERFGVDLTGAVLSGLTSSLDDVGIEICDERIPEEVRDRAITAMGTMIRKLAKGHLSIKSMDKWTKLDTAIFMFWDVAPIWPEKGTTAGKRLLDICLGEMRSALQINNPVALLHSLHGLSEFHVSFSEHTEPIMDAWIQSNPHADPEIMNYARRARDGLVP